MMPSALYELLAQDAELIDLLGDPPRIFELQSVDERPIHDGLFVIFDFQETQVGFQGDGIAHLGEQTFQIWVHVPLDVDREYNDINAVLNRIDELLLPVEHVTGDDGIRVTSVRLFTRSRNTIDPGWDTATRFGLYGVLFDQSAA